MDDHPAQLSAYGYILLIGIVGIVLVCVTMLLAKVLSPKKPNPIKLSTYECGEETVGSSWTQFNPRFYVIALIFLLFDVELIFIFPWATVFGNKEFIATDARWGWFTLIEMAIFIGILVLGLVYVWKKGYLSWVKATHVVPTTAVHIPASAYEQLNNRSYTIRDYRHRIIEKEEGTSVPQADPAPKPKLGFKPKFKNPNA